MSIRAQAPRANAAPVTMASKRSVRRSFFTTEGRRSRWEAAGQLSLAASLVAAQAPSRGERRRGGEGEGRVGDGVGLEVKVEADMLVKVEGTVGRNG